jgi:hypothetical protein
MACGRFDGDVVNCSRVARGRSIQQRAKQSKRTTVACCGELIVSEQGLVIMRERHKANGGMVGSSGVVRGRSIE